MYFVDRTAVVLKPSEKFLEWLSATNKNSIELMLTQLQANCTVYLIPEFEEPESAVSYFDDRFEAIFEAELSSWEPDSKHWPVNRNLETFWNFFNLEIHDLVIDTEINEMNVQPVIDNMM